MKIQYEDANLLIVESALYRTTSTVINAENYILLVDPNWLPLEIDFLDSWIKKVGTNKKKYLFFTHSDYDHIIGYGKFKDYKTIASKNFVNNQHPEKILDEIRKFDDEYYIKRSYPIEYPKIDIVIEKNEQHLNIGSDNYIFYQANGHNKDGVVAYNKSKQFLIAGDYLSNIEFPYIYESVSNYESTLKLLEQIINKDNIKILIPGHGDYTTERQEMLTRVDDSRTYISLLKGTLNGNPFDVETLFRKYNFPQSMEGFHKDNINLLKKEFNKL